MSETTPSASGLSSDRRRRAHLQRVVRAVEVLRRGVGDADAALGTLAEEYGRGAGDRDVAGRQRVDVLRADRYPALPLQDAEERVVRLAVGAMDPSPVSRSMTASSFDQSLNPTGSPSVPFSVSASTRPIVLLPAAPGPTMTPTLHRAGRSIDADRFAVVFVRDGTRDVQFDGHDTSLRRSGQLGSHLDRDRSSANFPAR